MSNETTALTASPGNGALRAEQPAPQQTMRGTIRRFLILVLMSTLVAAATRPAEATDLGLGGAMKCGHWSQAPDLRRELMAWIQGYVTAWIVYKNLQQPV